MSFIHVAIFKWKDANVHSEPITEALTELTGRLEGVTSYRCGPDIGLTPSADDYCVVGVFCTREHFLAYRDHPHHQQIIQAMIAPNLQRRSVVQIEDTSSA